MKVHLRQTKQYSGQDSANQESSLMAAQDYLQTKPRVPFLRVNTIELVRSLNLFSAHLGTPLPYF